MKDKANSNSVTHKAETVSLTKGQPTNRKGVPEQYNASGEPVRTQEQFYSVLEGEMRKIDTFTQKVVADIHSALTKVERELQGSISDERKAVLQDEVFIFFI